MYNISLVIIITVLIIFSSCDDNTMGTKEPELSKRQFIVVGSQFVADSSKVSCIINYKYSNSIGNWKLFYLSTSNDTISRPASIKLTAVDKPYINDTERLWNYTLYVSNNIPGQYIWIYYRFTGEFYDSTSNGLKMNSYFDYRDSIYLQVIK